MEWSVATPMPTYNFLHIPTVVCGPHEYSNPECIEKLGKDWQGQWETLDGDTEESAPVVSDPEPEEITEE